MFRQKSAAISKLIPASETVEWPGGASKPQTDGAPRCSKNSRKRLATPKGRATLGGINERLQAISTAIDDLEKANAADRTKDEDKQKLSEILSRADYQKPAEPEESLFQKIIRKIADWIDSLFPRPSNLARGRLRRRIIQACAAGPALLGCYLPIGFLIYKFAPLIFRPVLARKPGEKEGPRDTRRTRFGGRIGS